MEHREPQESKKASQGLLRALYERYERALADASEYFYAQILLEDALPPVAELFGTLGEAQLKRYRYLGSLLRRLGVQHALRLAVRNTPRMLYRDADSHAPVLAREVMISRIREANYATQRLKQAENETTDPVIRDAIITLIRESEDEAEILRTMERRLAYS